MAENSKISDTIYVRRVKQEANKFLSSIEYFSRAFLARDNDLFAMSPGSDPIQQFTDEDAQALGFADAHVMANAVTDLLNSVHSYKASDLSKVVAVASAGEV